MAKSYTRNSRGKKNSQVNWAGIWSKNIKSKDKLFNSEKLEENKKLLNVQSMLNGEVLRQYPQKQISLSSIVWNPTYNREMNMGHLYKIMSHFDLRALGEILVCDVSKEHGGKTWYEIIDGNHRLNCCKTLFGLDIQIQVTVLPYMPIEERAELYEMYNDNRKSLTQADLFRAREVQKDEDALNIRSICKSLGINITGVTESSAYPVIKAFGEMYRGYNTGVLTVVLRVIRNAYSEASTVNRETAFSRTMLRSIINLIHLYWDDIDFERLSVKVGELSSREWENRIFAVKQSDINGIIPLVEHYNKNLRSKKLDLVKQYIPVKNVQAIGRVKHLPEISAPKK
tara:strand:- start:1051 stop:2076 length:1026 start_codon:yes stop_codon:yes gene_type:complete